MSRFSCDICTFESFNSSDAILWAIQNPWFQECSSLAGALGEQENQGEASSSQSPPSAGVLEGHQEHKVALVPFDESHSSSQGSEDGHHYDSSDNTDDPEVVVDLHDKVLIFCRVGTCLYWHTNLKQVKRHRGGHFSDCFGYWCPNQTNTCSSLGHDFRRRDGVNAHCKRSPECARALQENQGQIAQWGTPPGEEDLVPYDPNFHKPYRSCDGRTIRQ